MSAPLPALTSWDSQIPRTHSSSQGSYPFPPRTPSAPPAQTLLGPVPQEPHCLPDRLSCGLELSPLETELTAFLPGLPHPTPPMTVPPSTLLPGHSLPSARPQWPCCSSQHVSPPAVMTSRPARLRPRVPTSAFLCPQPLPAQLTAFTGFPLRLEYVSSSPGPGSPISLAPGYLSPPSSSAPVPLAVAGP